MRTRTFKFVILGILTLTIVGIGIALFVNPIEKLPNISFSGYSYKNSDKYTQISSASVSGISNLDISWISGSVEIVSYNGSDVSFEETCDRPIPDNERLCFWKDGNTLRIKYMSSGFHTLAPTQKRLLVRVPASLHLSDFDLDVVSADVFLNGLSVDDADLEAVSGDLNFSSFSAGKIDYETVSGAVVAEDICFVSLDGESVSGKVSLTVSSACTPKEIDMETVSGNIRLGLASDIGFTLDFDSVSGDLLCNTEMRMLSKKSFVHGDGSLQISLETVSGDVTIN